MSKKSKKNSQTEQKKFNFKPVLIIIAALILCGAAVFGIVKGISSAKEKVLDVAFYKLPENVIAPLQEKISAGYEEKINFVVLTESEYNVETIAKKYDLFFSWDGLAVNQLSDKAQKIPGDAYPYILPSEIPEGLKYLPVLLDHWEMAYYKRGVDQTTTGYPRSLDDLEALLKEFKDIVFVPMYCSGGNDDELFAFISALTESVGGNKAYNKLVTILKSASSLDEVIDVELDSASKITLRTLLDKIKAWQEDDLMYPKWIYSKDGELINLGNQRQVGVFFTSLTKHRTFPLSVTEGYAADRFPNVNSKDKHALIANAVVCMKFAKSDKYDAIITSLVEPEFQYSLSKTTKYGPESMTSQSFDRQADDVRYLAAVSALGATADIPNAVFQNNSEVKANIASQIRIYLK